MIVNKYIPTEYLNTVNSIGSNNNKESEPIPILFFFTLSPLFKTNRLVRLIYFI